MEKLGGVRPSPFDEPVASVTEEPEFNEWLVLLGQSRDSDTVTRANFKVACAEFGIEAEGIQRLGNGAALLRFGHWAVGWYEVLVINPNDEKALAKATDIEAGLADYPVLDDDALSEIEWDEMWDAWLDWAHSDVVQGILKVNEALEDVLDDISAESLYEGFRCYGGDLEHTGTEVHLWDENLDYEALARAIENGEYNA